MGSQTNRNHVTVFEGKQNRFVVVAVGLFFGSVDGVLLFAFVSALAFFFEVGTSYQFSS